MGMSPDRGSEISDVPVTVAVAPATDRVALRLTALIGAALVVAIVKPWGGGPAAAPLQGIVAAEIAASPSESPSVVDGLCVDPPGWRVLSVQGWSGGSLRSWEPVEPVVASGPLDPAIPLIRLATQSVRALGHCAPWVAENDAPSIGRVEAWRVVRLAATPLTLEPATRDPVTARGSLFLAPAFAAEWPSGRYIFAIHAGADDERWFGVDVEDLSVARSGEPTPPGE